MSQTFTADDAVSIAIKEEKNSENNTQKIIVTIEPEEPKNFNLTVSDIRKMVDYLSRMTEKGLINETSGSSVVLRESGQVNVSAGRYSHLKLSPDGNIDENSIQRTISTNRLYINFDELVINQHKFNPYLIELSDFCKIPLDLNDNAIVGNFCVNGSVLVKAWDHNLKRYVLIRRPARTPIFSPLLNVPEVNKGIGVDDPLYMKPDMIGITQTGYKVNGLVSDANTLIGKEGMDRAGIDRSAENSGGIIGSLQADDDSSSSSVSTVSDDSSDDSNTEENSSDSTIVPSTETQGGTIDSDGEKVIILGKATATEAQCVACIKKTAQNFQATCSLEELVHLYYEEAGREGIRPDVMLAQSCMETGWFSYVNATAVTPDQNNFASLGVTFKGAKGNSFKTAREGVRAQVQHLCGYIGKTPSTEIVDQRYDLVKGNHLTYWVELGGKWGGDRSFYGQLIMDVVRNFIKTNAD